MSKIYVFDINHFNGNKEELEKELSLEILNCVNKYKIHQDYLRSLIGWYLLKVYLLKDFSIDLSNKKILFNNMRKPYIEEKINFNITHSNNYVAVIISDGCCGIDIEMCNEERDWNKLKDVILTNQEKNNIKDNNGLVKYWSKKEAYFKKLGCGIDFSKLKQDINYDEVATLRLKDLKNNEYYLSYISDDKEYTIEKILCFDK